ncbi:hypothetical protein LR48_Vigan03g208100 [Vigna angularis]|uniref:Uncharacterized protein n=1 Tax=Phaseolus angularis TaxID=3914 RepID=A0A0L9U8B6_PHAAN|nr:hypothetical protein LR48_Vigan03g208100 [Vigna angularis]
MNDRPQRTLVIKPPFPASVRHLHQRTLVIHPPFLNERSEGEEEKSEKRDLTPRPGTTPAESGITGATFVRGLRRLALPRSSVGVAQRHESEGEKPGLDSDGGGNSRRTARRRWRRVCRANPSLGYHVSFLAQPQYKPIKLIMSLEESPTMYRAKPTTRNKYKCRNARPVWTPEDARSEKNGCSSNVQHERTLAQEKRTLVQKEVEDARPERKGMFVEARQRDVQRTFGEENRTLVQFRSAQDARPLLVDAVFARRSRLGAKQRGRQARFLLMWQTVYLTLKREGERIFGCPNTVSLNWSSWRRARSCGNSPSSSLGLLPSSISTIVVSLSSPFMES